MRNSPNQKYSLAEIVNSNSPVKVTWIPGPKTINRVPWIPNALPLPCASGPAPIVGPVSSLPIQPAPIVGPVSFYPGVSSAFAAPQMPNSQPDHQYQPKIPTHVIHGPQQIRQQNNPQQQLTAQQLQQMQEMLIEQKKQESLKEYLFKKIQQPTTQTPKVFTVVSDINIAPPHITTASHAPNPIQQFGTPSSLGYSDIQTQFLYNKRISDDLKYNPVQTYSEYFKGYQDNREGLQQKQQRQFFKVDLGKLSTKSEISTSAPTCTKYTTYPSIPELSQLSEQELSHFTGLEIANQYGRIKFNLPINLLKLNIDDKILIQQDRIEMELDEIQQGKGLITMTYCNFGNYTLLKEDKKAAFISKIQNWTNKLQMKIVEFDRTTGNLTVTS